MFRFFKFTAPLLALFLVTAGPVFAQEEPDPGETISVFGEGSSKVVDGNYIAARKRAVAEALRNALDAALSTILTPVELEMQAPFLSENIFSHGFDFVHSYRFLHDGMGPPSPMVRKQESENPSIEGETVEEPEELPAPASKPLSPWMGEEEYDTYHVRMEFTVFLTYLGDALATQGITVGEVTRPKVVAIINEESPGVVQGPGFLVLPSNAEEKLSARVSRQGYKVYARQDVRQLGMENRVLDALEGERTAVKWLAKEFEAEYVILGSARSKSHPATAFSRPYVEGIVEAAIYDGYTARVLWSETINEKIDGGGAAAGFKAIRKGGETLAFKVSNFLSRPSFGDQGP